MKIERDSEHNIIVRDEAGEELHAYITTLAAIEFQQKIIPPRIPELSTQGWDVVVNALKECIDNLGSPYKITNTEVEVDETGLVKEIISVEPVEALQPAKTPEIPVETLEQNPPDTVIPPTPVKKTPLKR